EVLADRRLGVEVYNNRSAGYIVADLLDKYLASEGVTAGTIAEGVTIPSARFGYKPISDVLRGLAEASGMVWYIDYDKALHFVERDFAPAPWSVDENSPVRGVSVSRSLSQYRNRQLVAYDELTA